MEVVGYGMTRRCADKVFAQAGFAPGKGRDEVGVVELHDCFAANEACRVYSVLFDSVFDYLASQLITYPALGLCAADAAHKLVEEGDNTVSSRFSSTGHFLIRSSAHSTAGNTS